MTWLKIDAGLYPLHVYTDLVWRKVLIEQYNYEVEIKMFINKDKKKIKCKARKKSQIEVRHIEFSHGMFMLLLEKRVYEPLFHS